VGRFDKLAKILGTVAEEAAPKLGKELPEMSELGNRAFEIIRQKRMNKIPLTPEEEKFFVEKFSQSVEQADKEAQMARILKSEKEQGVPERRPQAGFEETLPPQQALEDVMNKKKASGMALGLPISGSLGQVDMNPLKDIKAGYEAYKGAKEKVYDKLAEQLDLTPEKAVKGQLKGAMDVTLDPLNVLMGPAGMGLGALQMGLEALPSESGKETRFDKLKKILDAKKAQERLP